jgi:hypothetical protein
MRLFRLPWQVAKARDCKPWLEVRSAPALAQGCRGLRPQGPRRAELGGSLTQSAPGPGESQLRPDGTLDRSQFPCYSAPETTECRRACGGVSSDGSLVCPDTAPGTPVGHGWLPSPAASCRTQPLTSGNRRPTTHRVVRLATSQEGPATMHRSTHSPPSPAGHCWSQRRPGASRSRCGSVAPHANVFRPALIPAAGQLRISAKRPPQTMHACFLFSMHLVFGALATRRGGTKCHSSSTSQAL